MTLRTLLQTEIPEPVVARAVVLIVAGLAFASIFGVVEMVIVPRASGETPGEAVMARGAYFFMFGPIAALGAVLSASVTRSLKPHLSKIWILVGVGPAAVLVPALIIGFFGMGG